MKKYLKTSEYAQLMGIHYRTAARHFHSGLLNGYQDENTKTIYIENPNYVSSTNKQQSNKAVLYARVSSTQNKNSLDGQIERLTQYAIAKGYQIVRIEKEIASGLNDNRRKLNSILNSNEWDVLLVEHKDRLTRFGFNYFKILEKLGQRVEVVNVTENKDSELMDDFISIITSFCGRIYGSKRKIKTNEIIESLKEECENDKK
jgi:predicted site-specific integrase-resolvase